jgi:hypothetical protein
MILLLYVSVSVCCHYIASQIISDVKVVIISFIIAVIGQNSFDLPVNVRGQFVLPLGGLRIIRDMQTRFLFSFFFLHNYLFWLTLL